MNTGMYRLLVLEMVGCTTDFEEEQLLTCNAYTLKLHFRQPKAKEPSEAGNDQQIKRFQQEKAATA
jgi:hypothetical protein